MVVSFICQLFGCLISITTSALCGLHLPAFELSFSKPTSSAATSSIPLKNVVIKDSYQKIASNRIAMHFYLSAAGENVKENNVYVWIIMNVKLYSMSTISVVNGAKGFQLSTASSLQPKSGSNLIICLLSLLNRTTVQLLVKRSHKPLWSINSYLPCLWKLGIAL